MLSAARSIGIGLGAFALTALTLATTLPAA